MNKLLDRSSHHWSNSGGVATLDGVFHFAEVGTAIFTFPFIRMLGRLQFVVGLEMLCLGQSLN